MASEGTCILNSQWTLEKYESESVSCSVVSDSATPCTVARQALLSMEFSRQEYWSGLPFPSPGVLPNLASNLGLLHCRQVLQFFFNLFYFILFVCVCSSFFIYLFIFTLQYCIGFAIHWHESATGVHEAGSLLSEPPGKPWKSMLNWKLEITTVRSLLRLKEVNFR